jgi:hypothetical protein
MHAWRWGCVYYTLPRLLLQVSLKDVGILRVSSGLIHWVELMNLIQDFLVEGHILNIGGDALN